MYAQKQGIKGRYDRRNKNSEYSPNNLKDSSQNKENKCEERERTDVESSNNLTTLKLEDQNIEEIAEDHNNGNPEPESDD